MSRITVIGIGSPAGDDQVGWRVAETLAGSAAGEGIGIALCRAPGGELAGLLSGAEVAILVDAVAAGGAPGTVYRFGGLPRSALDAGPVSSHGLGLQATLELLETLGDVPPVLLVYGIEAEGVAVEAAMSPAVARAVSRVGDEIRRDLRYFRREPQK